HAGRRRVAARSFARAVRKQHQRIEHPHARRSADRARRYRQRSAERQPSPRLPERNAAEQPVAEHVPSRGRSARRRVRRQHRSSDEPLVDMFGGFQVARTPPGNSRNHETHETQLVRSCVSCVSCVSWLALALAVTWLPQRPLHAQQRDLRLIDAIRRRDDKAFAALLRAKVDVNAAQADGATPPAWASHLGGRDMAEAVVDAGANVNTADEYGETPVTLAAANGDAELIRRLTAAGADASAARWNGETAVMIAAGAGSLESVRELVSHGA